jgi:hypothetical protein
LDPEVGVVSGGGKAWGLFLPWAALVLAGAAWALEHQTGSNLSFSDCDANGAVATGLMGLAALIVALVGAYLSWRVWREPADAASGRNFVALVSFLAALLLSLAIILQTLAAFILPECFA